MTGREYKNLIDTIECEGFEYTFVRYSTFENIEDKEFHKVREAYLEARKALTSYIGWDE